METKEEETKQRPGYVPIKSEFLVKTSRTTINESKPMTEDGASTDNLELPAKRKFEEVTKDEGKEPEFKRSTLKKRHQHSHPSKEERLCSATIRGDDCPYGDICTYSHDIEHFLSTKPEDLGETCYQYETFGFCPNGMMCRFSSSHIDKTTGKNLKRPDSEGGVIARIPINNLEKEVQFALRKKKYDKYLTEKLEKLAVSRKKSIENASAKLTATTDNILPTEESKNSNTTETKDIDTIPRIPTEQQSESNLESNTILPPTGKPLEQTKTEKTALPPTSYTTTNPEIEEEERNSKNSRVLADKCVKLVDFSNKVYIAPLTTVGNLPFRRILKEYGADITCGEMAMGSNILAGQASEWALLRRHQIEDVFGAQIAGNNPNLMRTTAKILANETSTDFVDINCGCPIDVVCNRGAGSSLMNKHNKLCDMVNQMYKELQSSRSITVKVRTGWDDKNPTTHKLLPLLQQRAPGKVAAVMIHGRSRLQRYTKLANWEYVLKSAQSQDPTLPRIPVIGNGDILSWEDWRDHQHLIGENIHKTRDLDVNADGDSELLGLCSCAMLARGALIKPWLPMEIKQQQSYDIPATERLDIMKKFCNYGLEHWGSDQQGVNNTRRFLLEWISFMHRYVPLGLIEHAQPQRMNEPPPRYFGRCDLETILASPNSGDWIKVSEMLLGPVPEGFHFLPKHKSNAYGSRPESEWTANG